MDKKERDRIVEAFREIAKDALHFFSTPDSLHFSDTLLVSSYAEECRTIIAYLLEDRKYFLKFSEEYLEKLLHDRVRELIQRIRQNEPGRIQKKARDIVEQLFNDLDNYATKQTVYLPVVGIVLQLEGEMLKLGNITFQKMTPERIDEVIRVLSSTIATMKYTSEEKEQVIKRLSDWCKQDFEETSDLIYAVYLVEAEPIRARERAIDECYQIFDLLRYTLPALYPSIYPMRFSIPIDEAGNIPKPVYEQSEKRVKRELGKVISFGLQGEVGVNTTRHVIILSDPPGFSWRTNNAEQFLPFKITSEVIKLITEIGVFEVEKILKKEKEERTDFERMLLRSIHWFANAQTPMQPEYLLLSLVSSLEAFFNPPDHEQVTKAVTESVAALGGQGVYNYVKRRVDQHYDARSKLSHGDDAELREKTIVELRHVAFSIIHRMIFEREEFKTQEQLFQWLKELRDEASGGAEVKNSAIVAEPD